MELLQRRKPLITKQVFKGITAAFLMHSACITGAYAESRTTDSDYLNTKIESVEGVNAIQQSRTLTGTVIENSSNEPLIGATVQIKGETSGVITDIDGNFSIKCSSSDVLVISYIGFKTQEIKVGSSKQLKIKLEEDSEILDDVVITAFGTGQKKESMVGSIQTVRPAELQLPSSNLSTSFAGKLSGVVAYQRSGMPGDNSADFFIRGISTISGMTSPLIIIDGVESSSGDLNAIDPEIIEGFSILKDATATAMYGTRGANGVMIVTTKSGADLDKPIIGFRLEANVTAPTSKPKFVNGSRYMQLFNEAVTSQGTGDVLFSRDQIENTLLDRDPYIYPNVNWYDEIFDDHAFNQKANFNIRGGSKRITYFMNMSLNHETGMMKNRSKDFYSYSNNINLMKYTFQNNIDFHMSKTSTISLHLSAQIDDMKSPAGNVNNIYNSIMDTNPVDFPTFFPNAGEKWVRWGAYAGGNDQAATNPLHEATRGYSDRFASTIRANIDFKQKLDFITEGLGFNAMVSFKNWSSTTTTRSQGGNRYHLTGHTMNEDGSYEYEISPLGTPTKPTLGTERGNSGDRRIYFQTYIDYARSFGLHNIGGLAVFSLDEFALNSGDGLINSLPRRKVGYALRASYDYDHRYIAEFNAGYNGSENFASGKRYGFFPSFAVGWNPSQEDFWESIKHIIPGFKVRGSYGLVGNDQIGGERFIYLSEIDLQGSPGFTTGFGDNTHTLKGPSYIRYQNNNISWEIGQKLNVGLDMSLAGGFDINVDWFREIRKDIFQERHSIPNYLGTANTKIFGNLAKVKNWGIDASIDWGKQFNRDLSILFKGTFTFAKNKVLEYDEAPGIRPANSRIGHALNTHFGYVTDKLYIDQADIDRNPNSTLGNIAIAPGDIKYVDQPDKDGNYDGRIDSDDRVAMGRPTVPQVIYGFGPTITYKQWDFNFFFQGAARTSLMMSGFHPFGTQVNRNVLKFVSDNYWSETNQNINAEYPRLTKYNNNHNTQGSDFWLRNGSFLKLKSAEVGYRYKGMRVYVSGLNLFTISSFKHWDPEMGGGAGLKYPTQRTFNIGLQMTIN